MSKIAASLVAFLVACTSLLQQTPPQPFTIGGSAVVTGWNFNLYNAQMYRPGLWHESLYSLVAACLNEKPDFGRLQFAVADSMVRINSADGQRKGVHANGLFYDALPPLIVVRLDHILFARTLTHEFIHSFGYEDGDPVFERCVRG